MGIYSTRVDITGQRFGRLIVLSVIEPDKTKPTKPKKPLKWKCVCDCGKEKNIVGSSLKTGECISCGCFRKELHSKLNWKGYEEISGAYFCSIRIGAKQRDLEFNITMKQIWELFLKQDRKCALTGQELVFRTHCTDKTTNQTASLDRIDSNKGYIIDNLQWIHKDLNFMKGTLSNPEFYRLCKLVVNHSESK